MKKRLIPLVALGLLGAVLTSCSGGSSSWTWANASSDGVLKYCLLIGQIDHNDSAARTAGIRDALGTRGTVATNPNTESPVEGSLKLNGTTYKVQEIEHAEQKNTAGATWDQQTATSTAETWINKHPDVDFFVSNNDGMAMGALGASNWIKDLPVFGYDSNADALQAINDGKLMGTINQNASAQAAGIYMVARNCIDDLGVDNVYKEGFSTTSTKGYGKISSAYTYHTGDESLLVDNFAITKSNVSSYLGKEAKDLIDANVTKGTTAKTKVWQSYYSATDNFLQSNMLPLFNLYKDTFNFDITAVQGDGSSESSLLDKLEASSNDFGAYIVNMIKTTDTSLFLDKIATKTGATADKPTNVPVIFWNRQGTKADGTVDQATMSDARFKYIYYVGFDANQGGQLQGKMIVDWLAAQK